MKFSSLLTLCLMLAACTGTTPVQPVQAPEPAEERVLPVEPEAFTATEQVVPAPPAPERPPVAPTAPAPPEPPTPVFTPLFTQGIQNWIPEDSAPGFFTYAGDTLHVTGNRGWLRSPRQYSDFILRLEFRFLEPSSDSGIFLRTVLGTNFIFGWPGDSYQVQVRDISENPTNPLPLGQLYRHVVPEGNTIYNGDIVDEVYTGVGEWQQYEITVVGDMLTVRLNGRLVTTADNLDNFAGYIGFQSETGAIEYRNIEIYEF